MTWPEIRHWESRGMRCGAHTRTHAVLSLADDALSAREIAHSWRRLNEEVRAPSTVFCYPNGKPGDFGARELATIRGLGMRAAVTATSGHCSPGRFAHDRFALPRLSYIEDGHAFLQLVGGLERAKDIARSMGAALPMP